MDVINQVRRQLDEIAAKEASKVFRLARRARKHGCSDKLVEEIREEGFRLYRIYPENLLDPFIKWKYAFKGGR